MSARHWALVVAVLAFHLGLDVVLPRLLRPDADLAGACAIGLVIGQLNLVAIWSALATGKIIVRLPWAAFLTLLMWYALVLGNRSVDTWDFVPSDAIMLGVLLLCGALLTQPPLWIARLKYGWRLLPPTAHLGSVFRAEAQFSLGQLLAGMAVVGVSVGLGRLVLPPGEIRIEFFSNEFMVMMLVAAMINLVVTAPCIWMAFARVPLLYGWMIGWIVYALLVSVAEVQILVICLGPPGTEPIIMIAWLVNLAQCGVVLTTLLLLRAIGFRFLQIATALEISVTNHQNEQDKLISEDLTRRGSDEPTAPPSC